jgi:hypothetical protein
MHADDHHAVGTAGMPLQCFNYKQTLSFVLQKKNRYRNVSVVPIVRRPSPTIGVRTATGKYSRRSVRGRYKFLFCSDIFLVYKPATFK